ncbi:hypothetical protein HMPREF9123_2384 [Neisseria bacilliformis ATCC BAA-1200]|uniref:Uncharacterized protein n=1 Tax=Neisseria bacilliformis ATCC BAA-1200 TaxID=888742 RepID=F2BF77_9NEIS|nr:hypothetical protein HMPREF9123_2384 [Neisseria bacilliformis ATCC BAA-1200]
MWANPFSDGLKTQRPPFYRSLPRFLRGRRRGSYVGCAAPRRRTRFLLRNESERFSENSNRVRGLRRTPYVSSSCRHSRAGGNLL